MSKKRERNDEAPFSRPTEESAQMDDVADSSPGEPDSGVDGDGETANHKDAPMNQDLEEARQRVAQLEKELAEFRAQKAAEQQAARDAETIKTYRVVARHCALQPRKIRRNGQEIQLATRMVQAKNEDHAKQIFVTETAHDIKNSGVAAAEKYLKEFLNSAPDADYDIKLAG